MSSYPINLLQLPESFSFILTDANKGYFYFRPTAITNWILYVVVTEWQSNENGLSLNTYHSRLIFAWFCSSVKMMNADFFKNSNAFWKLFFGRCLYGKN